MKPRITLLTLGVDDLERALPFYRDDGLGLPTKGIMGKEFEHGAVVFLQKPARRFLTHLTGLTAEKVFP